MIGNLLFIPKTICRVFSRFKCNPSTPRRTAHAATNSATRVASEADEVSIAAQAVTIENSYMRQAVLTYGSGKSSSVAEPDDETFAGNRESRPE